jgi:hypothetical protein
MGATMINASTFALDGYSNGYIQSGTVEVTLHGEIRRVDAGRNELGIQVSNISGRLKGGRKVYSLRLMLRPDGREIIEVYETPAPNVEGKVWAELSFGPVMGKASHHAKAGGF